MGRAPCCDKANVKKGPWSPEEDLRLKDYIDKRGTDGKWITLPQKAGLKRCGKSCRLRWLNYLRPNIKHGEFSDEEDRIILTLFATIGSRWSIIAAQLPGRTDNDIKNYWNTKLKKKLVAMMLPNPYHRTIKPSLPSSYTISTGRLLPSEPVGLSSEINHHYQICSPLLLPSQPVGLSSTLLTSLFRSADNLYYPSYNLSASNNVSNITFSPKSSSVFTSFDFSSPFPQPSLLTTVGSTYDATDNSSVPQTNEYTNYSQQMMIKQERTYNQHNDLLLHDQGFISRGSEESHRPEEKRNEGYYWESSTFSNGGSMVCPIIDYDLEEAKTLIGPSNKREWQ